MSIQSPQQTLAAILVYRHSLPLNAAAAAVLNVRRARRNFAVSMKSTGALIARWFMAGIVIGAVSTIPWFLFVLWLDHTELGQITCYTRAIAINRTHFEKGDRKVSLEEGARMGRPDLVGKGLVIPLVLLLFGLAPATRYLYGEKKTDPSLLDNEESRRWWRIAYGSSLAGAIAAILLGVWLLG